MFTYALVFLAGMVAAQYPPELPDHVFGLSLALAAGALLLWRPSRALAMGVAGMAWFIYQADNLAQHRLPMALEQRDIAVDCEILTLPRPAMDSVQFDCHPLALVPDFPLRIRLNWHDAWMANVLHPGQQWRFTVRLRRPHSTYNPGGMDYERTLFQQRIGAVGQVRAHPLPRLLVEPLWSMGRARQELWQAAQTHWAGLAHHGLLLAMTLGERHLISDAEQQLLRDTGTNHLLAISGMNITLVAWSAAWLGQFVWRYLARGWLLFLPSPWAGAWAGGLAALCYALLAGFAIPTQRALIMSAVVLAGVAGCGRASNGTLLGTAALAVVLWDAMSVMDIGFWLSFGAVALLLFVAASPRQDRLHWWNVHWLMAVGLAPFLILFALPIPLVSPLANFIAVPLIGVMAISLALTALILPQPLGLWLAQLADGIMQVTLWLLQALLWLVPWIWHLPALPTGVMACAALGIVLLFLPRGLPGRWLGWVGLLPVLLYTPPRPAPGSVWLTLLDVGQGLSVVAQTHQHTLVYDAGPQIGHMDTGRQVVAPFLWQQGIQRIHRLLISHPDNDHSGGAEYLLQKFAVDTLLASKPTQFQRAQPCQDGIHWQWDGVTFTIQSPPASGILAGENNLSCVLKISTNDQSALLTGDIEALAEQYLLRLGQAVRADILLAPHHGAATSSTPAFIRAVAPRYALISSGYHNRHHHPHPAVVERYTRAGAQILNTAHQGAIRFELGQSPVISNPSLARKQSGHFWND